MRSLTSRPSAVALAVLTLLAGAACGPDASTAPPSQPDATTIALSSGNPFVVSASGSGHRTVPVGGQTIEEGWRTSSFTARRDADGASSGEVQFNNRAVPSTLMHAKAYCVNDAGQGIVVVAAEVTHRIADQDPAPLPPFPPAIVGVDHAILFAVRDNGEGAKASAPDQITLTFSTTVSVAGAVRANPAGFGFTPAVIATFFSDVEAGNIQVR